MFPEWISYWYLLHVQSYLRLTLDWEFCQYHVLIHHQIDFVQISLKLKRICLIKIKKGGIRYTKCGYCGQCGTTSDEKTVLLSSLLPEHHFAYIVWKNKGIKEPSCLVCYHTPNKKTIASLLDQGQPPLAEMHQHPSMTPCDPNEIYHARNEEKPQAEQEISGGAQIPNHAVTFDSPHDDQNPQDWASWKKLRIRTQSACSQKIKGQENRKEKPQRIPEIFQLTRWPAEQTRHLHNRMHGNLDRKFQQRNLQRSCRIQQH